MGKYVQELATMAIPGWMSESGWMSAKNEHFADALDNAGDGFSAVTR
jgi:hypothetical protein